MNEAAKRLIGSQRILVDEWSDRLRAARASRAEWEEESDIIWSFYDGNCGFMWDKDFKSKYLKRIDDPEFSVTINKASEFVDIYGPYLFWQEPNCKMTVHKQFMPIPEIYGDIENDEQAAEMYQVATSQAQNDERVKKLSAEMMERVLNYEQAEQQPKLSYEGNLSIRDALLTGRGVLWPEAYSFPASDRTLCGLFYDSPYNLLIDSDCRDPSLKTAMWIARQHVNTYWEVERKFNLPEGSLKEYAELTSNSEYAKSGGNSQVRDQKGNYGPTSDLIIWYEIYSKMGVGTRLKKINSELHQDFEEIVGDFAYIAMSPNIPFFLNAPPTEMAGAEDDDVMMMFSWPFPAYMDGQYPVRILDFKPSRRDHNGLIPPRRNSAWPIPPLSSALGELITMNILASAALSNAWANRKQIIGYMKSAAEKVEEAYKNKAGTVFIELQDGLQKSVQDMIAHLNAPGMNNDIWNALEYVSANFDKRTGLVEFMYGNQSTQDRSARSVQAKEEKTSIRPEKMANDVAAFMSECFESLKVLTAFEVEGKDVIELLGDFGAQLWDSVIVGMDPEKVCRQMVARVDSSNMRRPNRDREQQNMQSLMQLLFPVLQAVASSRGDDEGIRPLQEFIKDMGKSMEQDTSAWIPPAFAPPPDPQAMEMQQQSMQLEMGKVEAETQQKLADAAKKTVEAEVLAESAGMESEEEMQKLAWKQEDHNANMMRDNEKHSQRMRQNFENHMMKSALMSQGRELRSRA